MQAPKTHQNKPSGVNLLHKAISIIQEVAESDQGAMLSEVSKRLGMPLSTTSRILQALVYYGYLDQNLDNGRYCLGPEFLMRSVQSIRSMSSVTVISPIMRQLSDEFGESVHLAVMTYGLKAVYVHTEQGTHMLRTHNNTGLAVPLHSSAIGRMLLAQCDDALAQTLLKDYTMTRDTPNTIINKNSLLQHLATIRKQGYALDLEERTIGLQCVAAPIYGDPHNRYAAISMSGPLSRMHLTSNKPLIRAILSAASRISSSLGHSV